VSWWLIAFLIYALLELPVRALTCVQRLATIQAQSFAIRL